MGPGGGASRGGVVVALAGESQWRVSLDEREWWRGEAWRGVYGSVTG